ncbi:MAG: ribonuclease HII [Flavobacteriaceae bacterium]|nr:ribonuclease HII [Bacteroidia bacterium]NNF74454.1 ribonuclease HII [Flavobacteriaceae bacterium]NNK74361.1 ribonuclease HII [Flavobacteriaceae bacterium]NNL80220.1 ribonuclease HII [Flavobacteriaceae bacterium]
MRTVLTLLVISLLLGCNPRDKKISGVLELVPDKADLILAIYDLETVRSDFNTNDLASNILTIPKYDNIRERLRDLNTTDSVLIWFEPSNDSLIFTVATRLHDSLFGGMSLDSVPMHFRLIDSFYLGSNSATNLDKLSRQENKALKSLIRAADGDKPFSIIMKEKSSDNLGRSLIESEIGLSDRMLVETKMDADKILINGVTYTNDSLPQILNVFKNNLPQENSLQLVAPSNVDGYLGLTYDDFQSLSKGLQPYRDKELDSLFNSELFESIGEVGEFYYEEGSLVGVKSIDISATHEALRDHLDISSTYRGVDILSFNSATLFKDVFSPFITVEDLTYYIQLEDHFIFGPNEEALQNVIAANQNGTVLGTSEAFKACQSNLSDASSLTIFARSEQLKKIMAKWFDNNMAAIPTSAYKLSAFQFVQDIGFCHFNGVIMKQNERAVVNAIEEVFQVELEADIVMKPQFVINHRTKQRDVVVQDVNNTLYMISNTGRILWKKKIIGNVLGKIEQVDLYRNGRLQLAFATPFRVYVLDRNGKNVSRFPMRFGDRITQPLSVFDYDNNRIYRFLVTQGKDLLMYDRRARFVRGFNYNSSSTIKTQPRHVRIGNKDYIVFIAGKRMKILSRRGSVRVGFRENVEFSGNEVFLYNNKFMTSTVDGQLIQVDQNGKINRSDLKLSDSHKIYATSKTLVTLDENKLGIKTKSVELDYGEYTEPTIHYINDKIYVTVTDLQSQKIYLYDSQAEPIANFPVYGNSTIDLDNADADINLEFVTQGESNSILMYKKN